MRERELPAKMNSNYQSIYLFSPEIHTPYLAEMRPNPTNSRHLIKTDLKSMFTEIITREMLMINTTDKTKSNTTKLFHHVIQSQILK